MQSCSKVEPLAFSTCPSTWNCNCNEILSRSFADHREMAESKRSKMSFSFGRKKAKKDAKLFGGDDQSIRSFEIMKINSDVSSDSGSSTRLSPLSSPLMFDKDTASKKYRAPEPPRSRQLSEEGSLSIRSDRSGSDKSSEHASSTDNLTVKQSSQGSNVVMNDKLPKLYEKIKDLSVNDSCTDSFTVGTEDGSEGKTRIKHGGKERASEEKGFNADELDSVFVAEGEFYNERLSNLLTLTVNTVFARLPRK